MAWNKRISTLEGAQEFWGRYGVTVQEHGRSEYLATHKGKQVIAESLTALWFQLGDKLIGSPTS
jgi:hypothetical protein